MPRNTEIQWSGRGKWVGGQVLEPRILVGGEIKAEGPGMRAGSEPVGAGAFTKYGGGDWDETTDPLIAGQQTALGLSIQGVSQAQLNTLKTRMEATKQKLEQAQAAPEAQRATLLQGLTGDHLTGDLLTATLWGYYAAIQSHGAIASAQAQMIDRPALSYGLFHAQVRPNKLYGIVTTGITFQGLNMDIGHLRSIRWVKDDNPQSAINAKPELTSNGKSAAQNRWIAYNKMRGQYNSAMEHAVPEQFWVDKSQCRYTDETGAVKNPTMADCAQGVSAVKAIAIAQAEGQRIYTINQSNAATALPKLPVGGTVGQEIQSAIQAGKEVTVHERGINAHGFSGYGYIITDPETGGGAYLIEGKGNGGVLFGILYAIVVALFVGVLVGYQIAMFFTILSLFITPLGAAIVLLMLSAALLFYSAEVYLKDEPCAKAIFQGIAGAMLGVLPYGAAARVAALIEAITMAALQSALRGGAAGAALGIGACLL